MSFVSQGFRGRRRDATSDPARVPPGQHVTRDFPVLSAGPTPRTPLDRWTFSIERHTAGDSASNTRGFEPRLGPDGRAGRAGVLRTLTWGEFRALAREPVTADIHCVTRWSKLDTLWEGVSVDTLLDRLDRGAGYVLAFCDGGYTTNLPLADVTGGKAWVVDTYEGKPLDPEHGGAARLLVPHLYFWKSAKWVRGLRLLDQDEPGFWETYGYHMYGDPWREQRYSGD
jgi:DMSO/TMAO reductase YedYZ molybdopterin-dependent catalytic subunit